MRNSLDFIEKIRRERFKSWSLPQEARKESFQSKWAFPREDSVRSAKTRGKTNRLSLSLLDFNHRHQTRALPIRLSRLNF